MSSLDERRAYHQRYKEDVERRGKPFYPYAMFHDTVMSLVVVTVIVGLACVWYFTGDANKPGEEGTGWLGVIYEEKADPGTTNFVPRPDWYFYFLFYLLRIFKWPDSVILGTVGIPTIALILLLALPFLDIRRERRLLRRPVAIVGLILTALAMGVLTYKGATAREAGETTGDVDRWVQENNLPENAAEGAQLFAVSGCGNCHTYLGSGAANVGAPDLSAIGAQQGKTRQYFVDYVADPSQFGNTVMPKFATLGRENLEKIAIFLEASKGAGG